MEDGGRQAFIPYAWDDAEHVDLVVRFADFLRDRCHVRVELDLDAAGQPQDWPRWMETRIRADVVLVVASPQYKRRAEEDDTLAPDEGPRPVAVEHPRLERGPSGDRTTDRPSETYLAGSTRPTRRHSNRDCGDSGSS